MTRALVKVSDVDLLQLSAAVRVIEIEREDQGNQGEENQATPAAGDAEEDASLE